MDKPPPLAGDEKKRSHQDFLNAIRNKFVLQKDTNAPKLPIVRPSNGFKLRTAPPTGLFTAQSSEQQSNIFDIPLLRNGYKKTVELELPQEEPQTTNRSNRENDDTPDVAFDIPLLRRQRNLESGELPGKCDLINLRQDVARIKITEDFKEPIADIDLTVALNSKMEPSTSSRVLTARRSPEEHFEIPFIECDRPLKSLNIIHGGRSSNEQTSNLSLRAPMAKPTPFGRVITLHYKSKSVLPCISPRLERKHKIAAFRFDQKSPDDIVTAALNKIPRRL